MTARGASDRLGDAPIEPGFNDQMNAVAHVLDELFNGNVDSGERKVGFVLLVFPFGDESEGRCNYISNANRRDVLTMLKEQIARFEGQPEMTGNA